MPPQKGTIRKFCPCGKMFYTKNKNKKYHSRECYASFISGAGNPMFGKPAHNKGVPMTAEQKVILSESKKGKPSTFKGKHHHSNSKEKLSIAMISRSDFKEHLKLMTINAASSNTGKKRPPEMIRYGSEASHWKGGLTPLIVKLRNSKRYAAWRTSVYERDGYRDWFSGVLGNGNLNAHHVVPFSELLRIYKITTYEEAMACDALWETSLGVTMLASSHAAYHDMWG
jgi:hypothetical protein